jgi:hypothetical protein
VGKLMARAQVPPPRACDLCGDPAAPYGFTYPGGRAAKIAGRRPLVSCAACRPEADARWRKAAQITDRSRSAPPGPKKKNLSLFD